MMVVMPFVFYSYDNISLSKVKQKFMNPKNFFGKKIDFFLNCDMIRGKRTGEVTEWKRES